MTWLVASIICSTAKLLLSSRLSHVSRGGILYVASMYVLGPRSRRAAAPLRVRGVFRGSAGSATPSPPPDPPQRVVTPVAYHARSSRQARARRESKRL